MARLPSELYLIQQVGGVVILFEVGSEREVVRFVPQDGDAISRAQKVIHDDPEMSDEDKSMAHFWSGYFWASGRPTCGEAHVMRVPGGSGG